MRSTVQYHIGKEFGLVRLTGLGPGDSDPDGDLLFHQIGKAIIRAILGAVLTDLSPEESAHFTPSSIKANRPCVLWNGRSYRTENILSRYPHYLCLTRIRNWPSSHPHHLSRTYRMLLTISAISITLSLSSNPSALTASMSILAH